MNKTILLFLISVFFAFGRDRDVLSVSCDSAYVSISNAKCAKSKSFYSESGELIPGVYSGEYISALEAQNVFGVGEFYEFECTKVEFHGIAIEFIPGKKTKKFAEKNKLKYTDNYIRGSWDIKIRVGEKVIWNGIGNDGFYIVFDCVKDTERYKNLSAFPPKSEIDKIAMIKKNEDDVKLDHFFADIDAKFSCTFPNQKTRKISKNFVLEFKDGVVVNCLNNF
jgi:hypothetical protein